MLAGRATMLARPFLRHHPNRQDGHNLPAGSKIRGSHEKEILLKD